MTIQVFEPFYTAQKHHFARAFSEIKDGAKMSHWLWFIFPQLSGLGSSEMAQKYALHNLAEAKAYLDDPVLGERLVSISRQLLSHSNKSVLEIFGSPDDLKLKSSMTLFSLVKGSNPVFQEILKIFYGGEQDPLTLALLNEELSPKI